MDRQVRQAVLGALAGLLDLPDGRLLLPSKATDVVDEFRYFGMLRVSHDMGETREYGCRICEDPVAHFSAPTIHQPASLTKSIAESILALK